MSYRHDRRRKLIRRGIGPDARRYLDQWHTLRGVTPTGPFTGWTVQVAREGTPPPRY